MVEQAPGPRGGSSANVGTKILAVLLSGLAINYVSDQVPLAAPAVIGLALLALIFLVVSERPELAETALGLRVRSSPVAVFAKFSFASLLLGALVGGISILPLGAQRAFNVPNLPGYNSCDCFVFTNYEVVAGGIVVALSSIAAIRKANAFWLVLFITSTLVGMTFVIVTFKPRNDFFFTFAGWLVITSLISFLAGSIREIVSLFSVFFRIANHPEPQAASTRAGRTAGGDSGSTD